MSTKLYVGNLAYACDDQTLLNTFSAFGEVISARVVTDRMSGRSKGFGFVEMADPSAASKAIQEMNGKELLGRNINVSEARPQEERPRSHSRGGDSRRFGGSGHGGGGGSRYSNRSRR
ncbi:MAG: RNA-binding protein [Bdellovibrionaceae bacterium]|nr:RNA-binding protein [Pseudobdellovibrionaceae bacterium]MDW8190924.1 RNA-binding protein [Pseudobdellovibrionaceae bacterium]